MYNDRRRRILATGSLPQSVSKWKESTKPNRVAHRSEINYEAMCVEYLSEYASERGSRRTILGGD